MGDLIPMPDSILRVDSSLRVFCIDHMSFQVQFEPAVAELPGIED